VRTITALMPAHRHHARVIRDLDEAVRDRRRHRRCDRTRSGDARATHRLQARVTARCGHIDPRACARSSCARITARRARAISMHARRTKCQRKYRA
jgi:hypothetical protein